MNPVKLFSSIYDPDARGLADQLRDADIDFSSIPSSGPITLWVDGRACYGITSVRYAVDYLIKGARYKKNKAE